MPFTSSRYIQHFLLERDKHPWLRHVLIHSLNSLAHTVHILSFIGLCLSTNRCHQPIQTPSLLFAQHISDFIEVRPFFLGKSKSDIGTINPSQRGGLKISISIYRPVALHYVTHDLSSVTYLIRVD